MWKVQFDAFCYLMNTKNVLFFRSNLKLSSNLVDKYVDSSVGVGPARLVVSLQSQGRPPLHTRDRGSTRSASAGRRGGVLGSNHGPTPRCN